MIERIVYSVAVLSVLASFVITVGFLMALVQYWVETRVRVIPEMDPPLDEYELRPDPMIHFYMDTLECEGRAILAREREHAT